MMLLVTAVGTPAGYEVQLLNIPGAQLVADPDDALRVYLTKNPERSGFTRKLVLTYWFDTDMSYLLS